MEIIRQHLCQNFVLHLVNLYDFGLVKPDVVIRTVTQIYRLSHKMDSDGLVVRKFLTGFSGIFNRVVAGGTKVGQSSSVTSSSASVAASDDAGSCMSQSSVPSPL